MISKKTLSRYLPVFFILASSPSAPSIIDFNDENQLSNTGFVRYNK
jgi:hypothetical protein